MKQLYIGKIRSDGVTRYVFTEFASEAKVAQHLVNELFNTYGRTTHMTLDIYSLDTLYKDELDELFNLYWPYEYHEPDELDDEVWDKAVRLITHA